MITINAEMTCSDDRLAGPIDVVIQLTTSWSGCGQAIVMHSITWKHVTVVGPWAHIPNAESALLNAMCEQYKRLLFARAASNISLEPGLRSDDERKFRLLYAVLSDSFKRQVADEHKGGE